MPPVRCHLSHVTNKISKTNTINVALFNFKTSSNIFLCQILFVVCWQILTVKVKWNRPCVWQSLVCLSLSHLVIQWHKKTFWCHQSSVADLDWTVCSSVLYDVCSMEYAVGRLQYSASNVQSVWVFCQCLMAWPHKKWPRADTTSPGSGPRIQQQDFFLFCSVVRNRQMKDVYTFQYVMLKYRILKLNFTILLSSEGYISQYTP